MNIVSLLQDVHGAVVYQEDVRLEEVHMERVKRSPAQLVVIASFQMEIPQILVDKKDNSTLTRELGTMRTVNKWDA